MFSGITSLISMSWLVAIVSNILILASSWKEYHVDLMVLHKHKKLHVIILRFIKVVAKNRQKRYAGFKSYTGRICFWKQVFAMATTRVIFWHRAKPILIFLAHLAKGNVRELLPSLGVRRPSSVVR